MLRGGRCHGGGVHPEGKVNGNPPRAPLLSCSPLYDGSRRLLVGPFPLSICLSPRLVSSFFLYPSPLLPPSCSLPLFSLMTIPRVPPRVRALLDDDGPRGGGHRGFPPVSPSAVRGLLRDRVVGGVGEPGQIRRNTLRVRGSCCKSDGIRYHM